MDKVDNKNFEFQGIVNDTKASISVDENKYLLNQTIVKVLGT